MSEVINLAEVRARKKNKTPPKSQTSTNNPGPAFFPYEGKLGEAMSKFGSATGNVIKSLFKKKDKVGDENV